MAYLFAAVFPGSWKEVGEQALETFEAALGNALEVGGTCVGDLRGGVGERLSGGGGHRLGDGGDVAVSSTPS